jgi:hypothetical protein
LQVSWIQAWPCSCQELTAAVDALILKGPIRVHVTNAGPKAADAKIHVTFRDLNRSAISEMTKDIHLDVNQHVDVVFIEDTSPTHMVLLRKSVGIEARISLTTAGMFDPDGSNNTKKITACTSVVD